MLFDYIKGEKLGQFVEFDSYKVKEANDLLALSVNLGNNDNKGGYVTVPFVVKYNGYDVKAAATLSVKRYVAGETIGNACEREKGLKDEYRELLTKISNSDWTTREILKKGDKDYKKANKYCTGTYRNVDWSIIRVYFPKNYRPLTKFTNFETV